MGTRLVNFVLFPLVLSFPLVVISLTVHLSKYQKFPEITQLFYLLGFVVLLKFYLVIKESVRKNSSQSKFVFCMLLKTSDSFVKSVFKDVPIKKFKTKKFKQGIMDATNKLASEIEPPKLEWITPLMIGLNTISYALCLMSFLIIAISFSAPIEPNPPQTENYSLVINYIGLITILLLITIQGILDLKGTFSITNPVSVADITLVDGKRLIGTISNENASEVTISRPSAEQINLPHKCLLRDSIQIPRNQVKYIVFHEII